MVVSIRLCSDTIGLEMVKYHLIYFFILSFRMNSQGVFSKIEGILDSVVRANVAELLNTLQEQLNQVEGRLTEITDTFNNRRGRIEQAQLDAGLSIGIRLNVSLISTNNHPKSLLTLELRPNELNDLAVLILKELTNEADWLSLICESKQALSDGKRGLCPTIVNQIKGNSDLVFGII